MSGPTGGAEVSRFGEGFDGSSSECVPLKLLLDHEAFQGGTRASQNMTLAQGNESGDLLETPARRSVSMNYSCLWEAMAITLMATI